MVCLVEEEVSVTPYFLHCPSERASHTCFFGRQEKARGRPGRDIFYRLGRRRKCTKNSTCASLG